MQRGQSPLLSSPLRRPILALPPLCLSFPRSVVLYSPSSFHHAKTSLPRTPRPRRLSVSFLFFSSSFLGPFCLLSFFFRNRRSISVAIVSFPPPNRPSCSRSILAFLLSAGRNSPSPVFVIPQHSIVFSLAASRHRPFQSRHSFFLLDTQQEKRPFLPPPCVSLSRFSVLDVLCLCSATLLTPCELPIQRHRLASSPKFLSTPRYPVDPIPDDNGIDAVAIRRLDGLDRWQQSRRVRLLLTQNSCQYPGTSTPLQILLWPWFSEKAFHLAYSKYSIQTKRELIA